MPRYFIEFSYDGSSYHGIQKQPNSLTIQEVLETNISKYTGSDINLTLAGRTDAGVHAKQMFAHFDIDSDFDQNNFCRSLNMMIPKDICIACLSSVNKDSHARFDAVNRTYEYFIGFEKDPFNYKFLYYLKDKLDINKMNDYIFSKKYENIYVLGDVFNQIESLNKRFPKKSSNINIFSKIILWKY